jgi:hypothetical protein
MVDGLLEEDHDDILDQADPITATVLIDRIDPVESSFEVFITRVYRRYLQSSGRLPLGPISVMLCIGGPGMPPTVTLHSVISKPTSRQE